MKTTKKYGELEIDLGAFLNTYNDFYEYLYNLQDEQSAPGYKIAVLIWEQIIEDKTALQIIRDFNAFRDDFISSDREAVSFIFTLEKFNIL